jgi:hypothetical protein
MPPTVTHGIGGDRSGREVKEPEPPELAGEGGGRLEVDFSARLMCTQVKPRFLPEELGAEGTLPSPSHQVAVDPAGGVKGGDYVG